MIFGAYDLPGLRFAPRIRDLDRQRLYRHGTPPAVETAELLKRKIRPELIVPYWDENDDFAWPHRDGLIWPHFSSVVVGVDVA